jgi:hyperosmotically inducible periplasmic protein
MRLIKAIVPAAVLAIAFAVPAFAQSAGESMHEAGQEMESAGTETWHAAENAGKGTVTAVHDTTITAKVKESLHKDEATKDQDIHVSTTAGVVTLKGNVSSSATATRAQQLTEGTKGVKSVHNELAVSGSPASKIEIE